MTESELAEIEARAAAATEGPWRAEEGWVVPDGFDNEAFVEGEEASLPVIGMWVHDRELLLAPNDAEFIARAREDVPRLVAEVRKLREMLADAHRYVIDGSFCSCDEVPAVPCETGKELGLTPCSHGIIGHCYRCVYALRKAAGK